MMVKHEAFSDGRVGCWRQIGGRLAALTLAIQTDASWFDCAWITLAHYTNQPQKGKKQVDCFESQHKGLNGVFSKFPTRRPWATQYPILELISFINDWNRMLETTVTEGCYSRGSCTKIFRLWSCGIMNSRGMEAGRFDNGLALIGLLGLLGLAVVNSGFIGAFIGGIDDELHFIRSHLGSWFAMLISSLLLLVWLLLLLLLLLLPSGSRFLMSAPLICSATKQSIEITRWRSVPGSPLLTGRVDASRHWYGYW